VQYKKRGVAKNVGFAVNQRPLKQKRLSLTQESKSFFWRRRSAQQRGRPTRRTGWLPRDQWLRRKQVRDIIA